MSYVPRKSLFRRPPSVRIAGRVKLAVKAPGRKRRRQCRQKVVYETREDAERRIRRHPPEWREKERVYECAVCGKFHVTTQVIH